MSPSGGGGPKRPKFGLVVKIRMTLKNPLRLKSATVEKVAADGMVLYPFFCSSPNVIQRTILAGRMQKQ